MNDKTDKELHFSAIKGTLPNCMNFDEIFMHRQSVKSNEHKV